MRHPRARLVACAASVCVASACLASSPAAARAAAAIPLPMAAERWETDGRAEFARLEGFPGGLLRLGEGGAVARGLSFGDGTIEYDVKLLADGFAGIEFRRQGADGAEMFYLRPDPECPAANDCVQYVPRYHGVWPWEGYPEYQAGAPVRIGGWNHVRLVVSGRRMDVFVNGAATPTLAVGRLEADALAGGLKLAGPGEFANLVVTPGAVSGLSPRPSPDPTDADGRWLRRWEVAPGAALPLGEQPALSQMPSAPAAWRTIAVERHGLVNLGRLYGSPTGKATGALAWLRTEIVSDRAQTKRVSLGFMHEASVYLNGAPVFAGQNLYYPEEARLASDGRLAPDNATFELTLRKGRNEMVVAVGNVLAEGHDHYGWGVEARLDDVSGVRLPSG